MRARLALFAPALVACSFVACSGGDPSRPGSGGSGGAPATGGQTSSMSGTSSSPTTGANTSATGTSSTASTVTGGGGGGLTVAECYADDFVNPTTLGPDYDQFGPILGSHCMGTNHQAIAGVERVVFLGDSVTVGTPPTLSADFYRSQVADGAAQRFGLTAPGFLWKSVNWFTGQSSTQSDGAFASCAEWGARTDDLLEDGTQLEDCLPVSERDKVTLVVMTVGGNDLSALTQAAIDGAPQADLWMQTQAFVQRMEEAIAWIKEPGKFPNGVFVVFGNMYEFTDGTGEVQSCDVSGLAGFDQPIPAPDELAAMVIWANEQFVRIAVDYQVDVVFMLEDFCGHGFERDNPMAPCYRGPGQDVWFDLTCIHPNPTGHDHVTDMILAVVDE